MQRRGFSLIDQKMSKLWGSELDDFGIPQKISHRSEGNRMKLKCVHLKELFAIRGIVPHCRLVKLLSRKLLCSNSLFVTPRHLRLSIFFSQKKKLLLF